MRKHYLLLLFILSIFSVYPSAYYVSPTGSNSNNGSLANPFLTISYAYTKAGASDFIYLRAGTYRETIALVGKSGSYNKPITLTAYNAENAIISGLDVQSLSWSSNSGMTNVWVASYSGSAFEQLFCDSKPMLEARWPNVPKDANGDWNFFSPGVWSTVDATGNSYGTVSDNHLALTGWNVTSARAVLNVNHQYYTWTRTILAHTAYTSTFTYPQDLGSSVVGNTLSWNDDRYYLVGQKIFLDTPGEWYYDATNKKIYYYPINGKDPNTSIVEIKTRNYAFTADLNSDYLTIDGITFWGTAFSFGKSYTSRSNGITFKNNKVEYSSWTEYVNTAATDPNVNNDNNFPFIQADTVKVLNNTFELGMLDGLLVNGYGNVIENNVFHDFCYTSSLTCPPLEISRNWAAYVGTGGNAVVRYNTIYDVGGISFFIGQGGNDVYLNKCYNAFRSCWGGNRDQSAIYTNNTYCSGTRIHHNWIYDSSAGTPPLDWGGGMAIRGDDNTTGLTIDHNVGWNIGSAGVELKNIASPTAADANYVYNNTFFQHSKNNTVKSALIVRTSLTNENIFSSVVNNMAQTIYGDWNGKALGTLGTKSNNSTGTVPDALMEDTTNYDFRPKTTATAVYNKAVVVAGFTTSVFGSAPDIGAYERGDSIYWIPGQRTSKAGFPIVPDATVNVSVSRDVLMWLQGYNAVAHQVYFGTNRANVNNAITGSSEYKGILKGNKNVYTLPALAVGTSYFWRIDAVLTDNTVIKGDIWSFSTGATIITSFQDTTVLNDINVYPTTTTDNLNITSPGSNLRSIEIYDLHGKLYKKINVNSDKTQVQVSDFSSGLYIVKINTDKNCQVKRFVKE